MNRGTRRERTNKIANRRFNDVMHSNFSDLDESVDFPGYFKKNNGFSIKKESSRLWNKIMKKRFSLWKFKRRNDIDVENE